MLNVARCSTEGSSSSTSLDKGNHERASRDPLPIFLDKKVQTLLERITGFDLAKIFRPKKVPLQKPRYQLLTTEQLEKEQAVAIEKGKAKLQMPPVMKASQLKPDLISDNPNLDQLNKCKFVFTDISLDIPHKKRLIVVREPDGKLRHASLNERCRLLQTYFPMEGRKVFTPKMFEEEFLEKLLEKGSYKYILDRACIQFEPDHPDYIRVTHRTYEHIRQKNAFDILRSTRHFGPMTFYYVWYKNAENLLVEMIQREQISDAADVVHLHNIIYPDSKCALKCAEINNHLELVKVFCGTECSQKDYLELALQSYEDSLDLKQLQVSSSS